MHAVLRQVRANLRRGRLQSTLILVTLLAAATLLAVALSTLHVAQGAYDRLFERTHGAHLWLELDPGRLSPEEVNRILGDLASVEATTGVMSSLPAILFAEDERLGNQLVREWPAEAVRVSRPRLVAGSAPGPAEKEAIVLDRNVAVAHGVDVGETVDLLTAAGRRPLKVVGLCVNSEFCPYPNCNPPRHFLAPGALTSLGLLPSPVPEMEAWTVGLRLRDAEEWKGVLHAAEERLPAQSIVDWGIWASMRRAADASIENQRVLLLTFSIVAGLAAGFLMANTIGEAVRAQTRQIGLLKAVGFTRRQVALVYLIEYLGLALLASVVGLGVGSLLASVVLRELAAKFGETLARPPLWIMIAAPFSTLLVAALFTLWPVRRAVQMDTVEAIRTGAERPRRRVARLPRTTPSLAVGVSDALSRPLRSLLTALGLGMAALTLTAAVTLNATVRELVSDPGRYGFDGDVFVYASYYMPDAEVRRLIATQPDVVAYHGTRWWSFQFQGEEEVFYTRLREGDLDAFRFPVVEGRMFHSADEVLVGYGLARERKLHPGDTVDIVLEGQSSTLQVVGIYRENSNLGRMIMLPMEAMRRIQPDVEASSYVLKLDPGADAEGVAAALAAASRDQLEVMVAGQGGVPDDIAGVKRMMVPLSLVLVGIAVVGTFNSIWIGVKERRGEFGMLKAVGMTPRQVMLSVLVTAAGTALVGYGVGVLVGLPGIRLLMDTVARSVGFGPLRPPLDLLGLALILPATAFVAMMGACIPAYRAGRTSVVEVLRYE
jgi:putative ABC transport system permease protein